VTLIAYKITQSFDKCITHGAMVGSTLPISGHRLARCGAHSPVYYAVVHYSLFYIFNHVDIGLIYFNSVSLHAVNSCLTQILCFIINEPSGVWMVNLGIYFIGFKLGVKN